MLQIKLVSTRYLDLQKYSLKREPNRSSITSHTNGLNNTHKAGLTRFFGLFFLVFLPRKWNAENTTISAAILCPAVCISDVINKTGMQNY